MYRAPCGAVAVCALIPRKRAFITAPLHAPRKLVRPAIRRPKSEGCVRSNRSCGSGSAPVAVGYGQPPSGTAVTPHLTSPRSRSVSPAPIRGPTPPCWRAPTMFSATVHHWGKPRPRCSTAAVSRCAEGTPPLISASPDWAVSPTLVGLPSPSLAPIARSCELSARQGQGLLQRGERAAETPAECVSTGRMRLRQPGCSLL